MDLSFGWAEADVMDNVEIHDRLVPRRIQVLFAGIEGQPELSMWIDSSSGVRRCPGLRDKSVDGGREIRSKDVGAVEFENWIEAIVPLFAYRILERFPAGRNHGCDGPPG